MIRVGVLGATGYTAFESIRLLLTHPQASVTAVTSRSKAGQRIAEIHPGLSGRLDLTLTEPDPKSLENSCDVALCCLPHGAAAETVRDLRNVGLRVIDFSADFRLRDLDTYQQWYQVTHPWPEILGKVAYGIPELFGSQIADADLVANPGCYPSSVILPLAPLLAHKKIDPTDLIVDAKSGVSGAGRKPTLTNLFSEANESIAPYGVGSHRHQPEMEDVLERYSGQSAQVLFTPHLVPMDRGILATIYARPLGINCEGILNLWRQQYQDSPFIHVVDHFPATKYVSGTNHVQMAVRETQGRLVILCVIDNLIKGASGAAIQNLNCMFNLDQSLGLET